MALALVLNRRRQVPAEDSPGFGAIAERFRRAGELDRAVALCQEGLGKYPLHLSSRVTLGWALLDLGRYDEARVELEQVLKRAPDNLAAIRGLAQLHDRTEHDDVASMQRSPSQWTPPDSQGVPAALDESEDDLGLPSDDPHMAVLGAGPGPWVGLDDHTSGPAAHDEPPSLGFEPFRRSGSLTAPLADPAESDLADQLLAEADVSVPVAAPPMVTARTQETLSPPSSGFDWSPDEPAPADDRPWHDDGVQLSGVLRAVPPPAKPTFVAHPQDDFVPDDGPGPWPPVLADDDPATASLEPFRLAGWSAERDAWPPVERRSEVKCVPVDAASVPAGHETAASPTAPRRRHLLKALGRFGRRVDARRRDVTPESVAG